MFITLLKIFFLVLVLVSPLRQAVATNNAFKDQIPKDWTLVGPGSKKYSVGLDQVIRHNGNFSATIFASNSSKTSTANLTQSMRPSKYLGKKIKFSGYLKTKDVFAAGLTMAITEECNWPVLFDSMNNRRIRGTSDWKKFEIILEVPKAAAMMMYGFYIQGKGQVWADDLSIEIAAANEPTTQDNLFSKPCPSKLDSIRNPTFESID